MAESGCGARRSAPRAPDSLLDVRLQKIAELASIRKRMQASARAFVEDLRGHGRHTFTRQEEQAALGVSAVAS